MTAVDTVVDVRGLRMRYGSRDVLVGVDFTVRRGEVITLLGPNGAGKTTTIEILEGFRLRSAGEVSVLGVDPARGDERWRARVGVVLQSWRDHGRWKVRDLLTHLGGYYAPYATPERERPYDVDKLIETVGLAEQAEQRLVALSGGQRRRLDVAVGPAGLGQAEVRWSRGGERFVHATPDATGFVRELFAQYGDEVADLEVRRASLEDTYMAMVHRQERAHPEVVSVR
jgi:predicted ABC-type transport system involved in lysophospholipase L1 biosynthesis ATPase subunit